MIKEVKLPDGRILTNVPSSDLYSLGLNEEYIRELLLIEAQAAAKTRVLNFTKQIRQYLSGHSEAERMVGWVEKEKRARRVINKTATDNDKKQLQVEVNARGFGETIEQLATRQIALSDELTLQNAEIDGMETNVLDIVAHCQQSSEIDPILQSFKQTAYTRFKDLHSYKDL